MVKAFETVVRTTTSLSKDPDLWFAKDEATKWLAKFYIDKARRAGAGSAVARSNIQRLIQLQATASADIEDDDTEARTSESVVQITLLLGRWYAQEKKDNEHARRYIRFHIMLGLYLLLGTNLYNESSTFQILAMAFMYYGDDVTSLAA